MLLKQRRVAGCHCGASSSQHLAVCHLKCAKDPEGARAAGCALTDLQACHMPDAHRTQERRERCFWDYAEGLAYCCEPGSGRKERRRIAYLRRSACRAACPALPRGSQPPLPASACNSISLSQNCLQNQRYDCSTTLCRPYLSSLGYQCYDYSVPSRCRACVGNMQHALMRGMTGCRPTSAEGPGADVSIWQQWRC